MMDSANVLMELAYEDIFEAAENNDLVIRTDGAELHQRSLRGVKLELGVDVGRDHMGRIVDEKKYILLKFEWVGDPKDAQGLYSIPDDEYMLEVEGADSTWGLSRPYKGNVTIENADDHFYLCVDYQWAEVEHL